LLKYIADKQQEKETKEGPGLSNVAKEYETPNTGAQPPSFTFPSH
jgi:hypothetical protein